MSLQPHAEITLQKAFATLTSLDRVKTHRTQLMKALNGGTVKALVHPYLPPAFVDAALGEVFAQGAADQEQPRRSSHRDLSARQNHAFGVESPTKLRFEGSRGQRQARHEGDGKKSQGL